jgi:putative peptide zinc metalloprotease protein
MDRPVTPAALQQQPASTLPASLPPLREDLQLHPAAPHADGSPGWVIQDPVTNAFYRIGWLEFELLSRWSLAEPAAILAATANETLLQPELEELEALYRFLLQSQLLTVHDVRYTRELVARFRKAKVNRVNWLLHHYLFFRIPIIHPADALRRMLPWLSWIFSRSTALTVTLLSLLGLVLTARQWDVFAASFMDTLSPGGLVGYLIALAVAKSLHELGHALTATRYGLRVAHMGVAFVVMWPMLYTDTGESWRLADRHKRLRIASAGIISELALAGLATLAWNLTGDGDMKQALFFLATTAWLISLGLNASPFMRFDGYFILSDALDMPNMHERAFALARTALRNTLLGWHEPDPEPMRPGKRRAMIAFAVATWLYRLVLFFGIAIAVYIFFFKLLGILLFAVEIAWFIVLPMWRELKVWHERRAEISAYRKRSTATMGAVALLIALVPWGYQVHGHGLAQPTQTHVFYSPLPAMLLTEPPAAGLVEAGAPIFALAQPELAYRAAVAGASAEALNNQLRGLGGITDGEEKRAGLTNQFAMHNAEIQAQSDEAARLALTAPFAGVLTDLDPDLAAGVWVSPRQPLAMLVAPEKWQAELLIGQKDLERIEKNAPVRFYPEGGRLFPLAGTVVDIASARSTQLPHALLSSQHGGSVPVIPDQQGLTPRDALYRVRVLLSDVPPDLKILRGEAVIEGRPESWLIEALKPILIVLIRELSF